MTQTTAQALPELLADMAWTDTAARLTIGDGWLQGRTAYGGLSAAIALGAVLARWTDLPPLRSAQIAFVGPLVGEVEIVPTLLRRGRTAAFVQADIRTGDTLGLRAAFVFMHPQDSHVRQEPPQLAAAELPPMGEALQPPPQLAFAHRFELRDTGEERDGVARLARWARLRERDGLDPMVELLAIGDVLPPAAMRLFRQPGPISSMTWQLNALADRPTTADGWWLARADTDHALAGSSSQTMSVWNREGRQVAAAMQSVAIFV
jgi:acyl-CoA thioesterase